MPLNKVGRQQTGFSLLEMVVAMVILSLSLSVLYQATSGATRNVRVDERYAFAVELARSLLADSAQVPRSGYQAAGETSGGFRWTVETHPIVTGKKQLDPGLLQDIKVVVSWNDGKERSFELVSVVQGRSKKP
ncbi:prepilin-type N-terminal cleavage/methylation domain-containing protein [Parahaliea sp. F7430]|uniref:Prepilin-type N-terminal cleavage/methylation domain-containing protein n=1 Tax=Sediminihaliea albiluteola TaxID=2758564 RepID=A0A7W2TYG9_9GAMM|nr:prepilin-type N-terminal cleavage/methylation domain-containing protein [Sediminihaliea albiluteola]MBA6414268.1 prepilin-type N-terminal cleavage/methylation domain-containing protein [Sediminihaliea albiluteola]